MGYDSSYYRIKQRQFIGLNTEEEQTNSDVSFKQRLKQLSIENIQGSKD